MATDALIASASSPSPPPPAQSPWDQHSTHEYSSYAGSYGSASDWGQNDNDGAPGLAAFGPDDGYNPTDFDASPPDYGSLNPSSANLNFFDHENLQPDVLADLDLPPGADQQQFVSLSLTPAEPMHKHHPPSPFVNPSDLSSPGSSPGSVHNAGDGPGRHSRHSSVGSHHSPLLHHAILANYGPSPPTSPPEIKATSPPALVIPSDPTGPSSHQSLSQSHLLPATAGIDINIVPSTPISPGAAGQSVAFQTVLQNLNAAAAQATSSSTATRGGAIDQGRQQQHRQTSPAPLPAALAGSPRMPPASIMDAASPQVPMWNISPHGSPMPGFRPGLHLRNSSEDSVRVTHSPLQGSPNLPPAPFPRGADLATGLVNLSLGLNGGAQPFASPQPSPNPNDMLIAAHLRHHRSRSEASMNPPHWGPHAHGSPAPGQMGPMFPPPDLGFGGLGLSGMPNSGMGGFPPAVSQTGAPSSGFAPAGFDMGHPASQPLGGVLPPFKMTPHSFDDSGDMLLPGIRRSRSDASGHRRGVRSEDFSQYGLPSGAEGNDLLRSITTPDGALAPSDPRVSPSMRRRGSSRGSHERGSSISSGRPSPYPSPNASPRHPEEMLPMGLDGGLESAVSRPHVTTPATAVASNSRRKTEANFVCPVPGCGSTFTRHFNLKGHLRSHNEERPFKCKWPGCEKGFARQHDCKRHEALHLNIRPYTCDGCGKTFARMDALNRHLRSEGGVECRRLGDDGMDVNMSGLDQMNPAAGGLHPLPLSAGNEWSHAGGLVL